MARKNRMPRAIPAGGFVYEDDTRSANAIMPHADIHAHTGARKESEMDATYEKMRLWCCRAGLLLVVKLLYIKY